MRRVVAICLASALPIVPASALTMGEVGQSALDLVQSECSDAFERHRAFWPEDGAERDVIWRNETVVASEQEIVSETPALLDHLPRLTAWQMSGFALVDDLSLASVISTQEDVPSPNWLENFGSIAQSLGAAADVYDCARLTDEGFAAAIEDGAGAGLLLTVQTFDCLSSVGHRIAGAYDATASSFAVHEAANTLVAEIDACEEG